MYKDFSLYLSIDVGPGRSKVADHCILSSIQCEFTFGFAPNRRCTQLAKHDNIPKYQKGQTEIIKSEDKDHGQQKRNERKT